MTKKKAPAKTIPPIPAEKRMRACSRFLAKLKEEMGRRGKRRGRFSKECDVPVNAIKDWEKGSRVPLDLAWQLADGLKVSLDYLADDRRDEEASEAERAALEIVRANRHWTKDEVIRRLSRGDGGPAQEVGEPRTATPPHAPLSGSNPRPRAPQRRSKR